MKNLNLLFNKTYYAVPDFNEKEFTEYLEKKINPQIFNATFDNARDYKKSEVANQTFLLKTSYPGLLIGTGNPHGTGFSTEDINVGFSFDYVTGQPYIPGSSVKGVLRSYFKNTPEVIAEILGQDSIDIKELEKDIFDDGKDVFFDAVIYDGDKNGGIVGKDYITPHSSPIKNPVPIFIIKVLPDVRIEFRFALENGILTAGKKKWLFKELLCLFGVGAKTNVGYGVLQECDKEITAKQKNGQREQSFDAPVRNVRTSSGSSEYKICKHCNAKNYKYNKNNPEIINRDWNKNICFKCKGALE